MRCENYLLKQLTQEHKLMANLDTEKLVIAYADGGSRGNPGPSGCGAILEQNGQLLATVSEFIGVSTNNIAEYTALIKILERALAMGVKHIEVRMDSELVVKQMCGQYAVKNLGLQPLFRKADMLSQRFSRFTIAHVRREANKKADELANQAMDKGAPA